MASFRSDGIVQPRQSPRNLANMSPRENEGIREAAWCSRLPENKRSKPSREEACKQERA